MVGVDGRFGATVDVGRDLSTRFVVYPEYVWTVALELGRSHDTACGEFGERIALLRGSTADSTPVTPTNEDLSSRRGHPRQYRKARSGGALAESN